MGRAGWAPEREREWEWEHRRHGHGCECEDCHDYRRRSHHHPHDRCRRCGSDSCECYCCIGDVDLAVYAYSGEQRVIPIRVENERHREKQITLELSQWTTAGGRAGVVDTIRLEPQTFTLAPCGEQNVTLVVGIAEDQTGGDQPGGNVDTPGSTDNPDQPRQRRDVDQCLVVTADLRLVGCDHRPLRIAVAILPRGCDPHRVSCGCACC
jgi:hypothetical protein